MSKIEERRRPKQDRSERLVENILSAAAALIAASGYDAVTMTAIAEQAGVSIGALYQYFRNKESIGRALREQYSSEMDTRWGSLEALDETLSVAQIVDHLFELLTGFIKEHPAYLVLLTAPLGYRRNTDARNRLRQRFAKMFMRHNPRLTEPRAFLIANVTFEVIKGLNSLTIDQMKGEGEELVHEFRDILNLYLRSRLSASKA